MFEKDNETEEANQTSQPTNVQSENKVFKYNTPYTLETEQSNLPHLKRALEMWETAFKKDLANGQKGEDNHQKGEKLLNLEIGLDTMIACGTRLIAMKQVCLVQMPSI